MADEHEMQPEEVLPACKEEDCDCEGFLKNPLVTTDCLNCHHDFLRHRRAQS